MFASVGLRKPDFVITEKFSIGTAINEFQKIFSGSFRPDIVLPHGDTKTAMAAAIAAHFLGIPVGHVEAGLRTGSREPWPEQTDTRIADACSNLFFASTRRNYIDLLKEGFKKEDMIICGNTVVDIAKKIAGKFKKGRTNKVYFSSHREENLRSAERFKNVVKFCNFLANEGFEVNWVMRPKTIQKLQEYNLLVSDKVVKIKNLNYPESIKLLNESVFVCTDSGGLQEEASALHIPCLTMRYVTDRPETVEIGSNGLTTLNFPKMKLAYKYLLKNYSKMKSRKCPYGKGDTSEKIIKFIEKRKNNLIRWEK
jgi:UDP-N-acetylglucosamine 2-epimerase (non-hydrolysing)